MPLYEYQCQTCGHNVEILHSVHAPPPRSCGQDCALDYGEEMGVGSLVKKLSVTGGFIRGGSRATANPENCQSCGMAPDSCS